MYMDKFEAAEEIHFPLPPEYQPKPERDGTGTALLGVGFLIVALPYWGLRLLGEALWLDVRRAGRVLRIAGAAYGDELRRR